MVLNYPIIVGGWNHKPAPLTDEERARINANLHGACELVEALADLVYERVPPKLALRYRELSYELNSLGENINDCIA